MVESAPPADAGTTLPLEALREGVRRRGRWWVLRRRLLWGFLVLLPFLCHESGTDCCAGCGSYRSLSNWGVGIGLGDGAWLFPIRFAAIRPTRALADLFPPGHEHDWRLTDGRKTGILSAGPIVCGGLYRNAFADAYEEDTGLRRFLLGEIGAGRMTREEVLAMFRLTARPWRDTGEEKDLRLRACRLMKDHAGGVPGYFAPRST